MYYKKFSQKEMEIIRTAIARYKKDCTVIAGREIPKSTDAGYNDFKISEKIEKKLVHCFYLVRGNK